MIVSEAYTFHIQCPQPAYRQRGLHADAQRWQIFSGGRIEHHTLKIYNHRRSTCHVKNAILQIFSNDWVSQQWRGEPPETGISREKPDCLTSIGRDRRHVRLRLAVDLDDVARGSLIRISQVIARVPILDDLRTGMK